MAGSVWVYLAGSVWELNMCVYGFNDASKEWYITIGQKLLGFGATV